MAATGLVSAIHRSQLAGPVVTAGGLLAGALVVAAVDPSDQPLAPPCPFRTVTGWWCPGCGLTRATHHVLHGHLLDALKLNALVVPALLAIAVSWWAWLRTAQGHTSPITFSRPAQRWAWTIAGVLVISFAVMRNLPGVNGLRG